MLLAFQQPNTKTSWVSATVLSKNFDILWLFYLTLSWSQSWWEKSKVLVFHLSIANSFVAATSREYFQIWSICLFELKDDLLPLDRDVFKQALKEFVYLVTLTSKCGLKTSSFSALIWGFLSRQAATSRLSRWSVKIASHSWGPQRAPLLSGQILYPHLYKVQMGMYCKSSRLNSFVTKETSVEILPPAVRRDTEPLLAILLLTEGWRNGRTVSPQCLCPIENGFHGECGGHGLWVANSLLPQFDHLVGRCSGGFCVSSKIPAMKKNPSFPVHCACATYVSAFNIYSLSLLAAAELLTNII